MDDIWQQFHRLPKHIRDAVATPAALAAIDRLERQYPKLDLAAFVMSVMVKEITVQDLAAKLSADGAVDATTAQSITAELTKAVFAGAGEYLGLGSAPAPSVPSPTVPVNVPPTPPVPPQPSSPVTVTPPRPQVPQPMPTSGTNVAPTQHYSQDDDQEIAAQTKKVKSMVGSSVLGIDQLAEQVMQQHNLAFHDELLQKRASSLLKARLKGIRSSDDTKAMLMRPPKVGGLGLDPDLSVNVVASLDEVAQQLKSRGAVQPPEPIPPPPPIPVPKVEPQHPAPRPPLTRNLPAEDSQTKMPPIPIKPSSQPAPAIKRPADIPPLPPMPETKSQSKSAPPPVVHRERQRERPAIADIVRPTAPTMGPAGEMSSMTLVEFRRLGQGATDTAKRLLEKFDHYQKESFALWAQALAGWRQSEVYRVYLDMGRQSLDQGVPMTEVVKQRAASGQPYLSEHEFMTIADLNRRLQP